MKAALIYKETDLSPLKTSVIFFKWALALLKAPLASTPLLYKTKTLSKAAPSVP